MEPTGTCKAQHQSKVMIYAIDTNKKRYFFDADSSPQAHAIFVWMADEMSLDDIPEQYSVTATTEQEIQGHGFELQHIAKPYLIGEIDLPTVGNSVNEFILRA